MSYFLDAWVEQSNPFIRIVDLLSGETIKSWRGKQVNRLFDNGVIDIDEIISCDNCTCQECIVDLLAYDMQVEDIRYPEHLLTLSELKNV